MPLKPGRIQKISPVIGKQFALHYLYDEHLSKDTVQFLCVVLADCFLHVQDFHLHILIPKLDGNDISHLHVQRCLCHFTINLNPSGIT